MFLRKGPHGTSILDIPSVLILYNGEPLDEKTILLRSSEVLPPAAVKLLDVLGDKETKRDISNNMVMQGDLPAAFTFIHNHAKLTQALAIALISEGYIRCLSGTPLKRRVSRIKFFRSIVARAKRKRMALSKNCYR
ncbi:uncharacterized protein EV422DRAFT_260063 [Fimicolochytrium jonesii]|uniref:uncharacterized protein n=1 Tax=Fimicolochytrium jonesii TaxID=1396493 RepID=UPI0022FEE650|nr:uncharacterized protein EV422DRAFT_260063 [Fimicolochytrium jonesii]KAI8817211.1 hypothetical protein EV422DRAFT_260063 [Fimicolochytrium jonesii]